MGQRHDIASVKHHYCMLGLSTLLSAVVMYLSMYAMIDTLQSFYNIINQAYMELMMAAPMVVIMLLTMRMMYPDKPLKSDHSRRVRAGVRPQFLLRYVIKVSVGDRQFLRSMIPHHSGAILMCEQAKLTDSGIVTLCSEIIKSQKQEIEQMRSLLQKV